MSDDDADSGVDEQAIDVSMNRLLPWTVDADLCVSTLCGAVSRGCSAKQTRLFMPVTIMSSNDGTVVRNAGSDGGCTTCEECLSVTG
jgi:hypothetical protein